MLWVNKYLRYKWIDRGKEYWIQLTLLRSWMLQQSFLWLNLCVYMFCCNKFILYHLAKLLLPLIPNQRRNSLFKKYLLFYIPIHLKIFLYHPTSTDEYNTFIVRTFPPRLWVVFAVKNGKNNININNSADRANHIMDCKM